MNAEQARRVEDLLRRLGIPGVVAPEDPVRPEGPWRVYDSAAPATRRDITPDALASLATRFPDGGRPPGPARGFVVPPPAT
ncbi:hypothetical protein [Streptomyces sp. NRRL F-5123]|uniref:hypothetical protein n=1 Tax=Streptomyces sp. NRRL F-5123 TaxID=1463856 RepID=UPI0004E11986|nr:hypothetical protein [Streptomyces sp. NRRL F-5123]